jgi:hypothetical protein
VPPADSDPLAFFIAAVFALEDVVEEEEEADVTRAYHRDDTMSNRT